MFLRKGYSVAPSGSSSAGGAGGAACESSSVERISLSFIAVNGFAMVN